MMLSEVLAWQRRAGNSDLVLWEYRDPSNATYRMAGTSGIPDVDRKRELDPAGSDAGVTDTFGVPHSIPNEDLTYPGFALKRSEPTEGRDFFAPRTRQSQKGPGSTTEGLLP